MRRRLTRLGLIAHHEAGHAVLAWVQGLPIKRVHVVPNEKHLGAVVIPSSYDDAIEGDGWNVPAEREWVDPAKEARVDVAGYLAVRRLSRSARTGASADLKHFEDCVGQLAPKTSPCWEAERRAWRVLLRAQARGLLEKNWPSVETLAAALVARRDLTGDEAAAVLAPDRGPAVSGEADY
jgi:hypothetical protein